MAVFPKLSAILALFLTPIFVDTVLAECTPLFVNDSGLTLVMSTVVDATLTNQLELQNGTLIIKQLPKMERNAEFTITSTQHGLQKLFTFTLLGDSDKVLTRTKDNRGVHVDLKAPMNSNSNKAQNWVMACDGCLTDLQENIQFGFGGYVVKGCMLNPVSTEDCLTGDPLNQAVNLMPCDPSSKNQRFDLFGRKVHGAWFPPRAQQ